MLIREIKSGSCPDPVMPRQGSTDKGPAISKRSHPPQGIVQMRSSQDQIEISL